MEDKESTEDDARNSSSENSNETNFKHLDKICATPGSTNMSVNGGSHITQVVNPSYQESNSTIDIMNIAMNIGFELASMASGSSEVNAATNITNMSAAANGSFQDSNATLNITNMSANSGFQNAPVDNPSYQESNSISSTNISVNTGSDIHVASVSSGSYEKVNATTSSVNMSANAGSQNAPVASFLLRTLCNLHKDDIARKKEENMNIMSIAPSDVTVKKEVNMSIAPPDVTVKKEGNMNMSIAPSDVTVKKEGNMNMSIAPSDVTVKKEGNMIIMSIAPSDLQTMNTHDEQTDTDNEPSTSGYKNKSVLHIDTSLIPQVPSSQQSEDLRGLGVDVYSHAEFQQNVLQQVDEAIIERENAIKREQATKEVKSVLDDIRSTKQSLSHIKKVLSTIPSRTADRESQRKLISVKKQKDNKIRQLKKLKAKHKKLLARIHGSTVEFEVSDLSDEGADNEVSTYNSLLAGSGASGSTQPETEHDRLIRLGEITPFGSQVTFQNVIQPPKSVKPQLTDFERFLLNEDTKAQMKVKQKNSVMRVKKKVKKTDDVSKIKNSNKLKGKNDTNKNSASNTPTDDFGSDRIDDRRVSYLENRRNKSLLNLDKLERTGGKKKKVPTATLR